MTHPDSSHHARCVLFAVVSSVLSSVATVVKVQGVHYIHPLMAATVGVLFAGVLTLGLLAIFSALPTPQSIRQVWRPLLMLVLCRPILSNIIFTIGIAYSSGVEAVFLTKMEPYLVIFWAWMLDGVRPSKNHLLLLIVHVLGALLLSVGDFGASHGVSWFGDLLIFAAVTTAALSYRYAPRVTRTLSPLQTAGVAETIGGLVTLPFILLAPPLIFSHEEMIGWMYVGAHSILFYILAVSLLYASLNGLEGWLSSALRATGPLVGVPIALVFFGESLTMTQAAGAMIVLVTSVLISKRDSKRDAKGPLKRVEPAAVAATRFAERHSSERCLKAYR